MTFMLAKTYNALRAAEGVSDELAQEAAIEIGSMDRRLLRLEIMVGLALAGILSLVMNAFLLT